MESVIAKCGHEVSVAFDESSGEILYVPDCCSMCEELIEEIEAEVQ